MAGISGIMGLSALQWYQGVSPTLQYIFTVPSIFHALSSRPAIVDQLDWKSPHEDWGQHMRTKVRFVTRAKEKSARLIVCTLIQCLQKKKQKNWNYPQITECSVQTESLVNLSRTENLLTGHKHTGILQTPWELFNVLWRSLCCW